MIQQQPSPFIRVDDYPVGDPTFLDRAPREVYLTQLFRALSLFEDKGVPYKLGVTPLLIEPRDVDRLNETVKLGEIVMHGFNHGWNFKPWSNITSTWASGGEFGMVPATELQRRYSFCDKIMRQFKRYDPLTHIPPFNCYNQDFVDVFAMNGGKVILGCDKDHVAYNHGSFVLDGVSVNLSRWQVSYADVPVVLQALLDGKIDLLKEHITLHWMYDTTQNPQWFSQYGRLADEFLKRVAVP